MPTCDYRPCGKKLPASMRSDAKFCSPKCRIDNTNARNRAAIAAAKAAGLAD